jgi:hypothetical protein
VSVNNENTINAIKCDIKEPPERAAKSHEQILLSIKMKGIRIQNEGEGPIVVTSVMSSRTITDIKRDMKAANVSGKHCRIRGTGVTLYDLYVEKDCERVILLRIVPVNNPDSYQEMERQDRFLCDLTFLVDQLDLNLLECDHNNQAVDQFVNCINN